jgi:hypothetical protein
MSGTADTGRRGLEGAPPIAGEGRSAPLPGGEAPEPTAGVRESRRRGALLRRLLAFADWTALIASLFVVTAISSSTSSSSCTASTTTTTAGSATAPSTNCPR